MHGDRNTGFAIMAVLYAVSGALSAIGAVRPLRADTPVALLAGLAVVGVVGAFLLWAGRHRLSDRTAHAALLVFSALVAVLAWRSVTAVGIVGLGPAMVAMAVWTGHFLPLRTARVHVAVLVVLVTAGAVAAAPGGFANAWVATVVTVCVLAEVQGRTSLKLIRAAATDPLTGVANRRSWEAEASRDLAHAHRSGEPLTVAVLDLDHFKAVNDGEGHVAGDDLLRALAQAWGSELRGADLLGRYGGDEFVLCLPGTDAVSARELLARLRARHDAAWSAGTATARPGDTLRDLLSRADEELYRVKRARTA
ncbi:diguanylate cyclase [Blastococcus sp. TF02A-26]|uniref:GGDEF domain-containing protein n=1 Tax=Blastococcus sp. TF02A-26 TaxID=2250577 RepID=UPI000DE9CA51|nr:GGDEF domain-containing protein [Blastococcus sp. TF02A-26]RBY85141.1 hypothetical protein DQ240_13010 [Blastococcus sp. TF02A-26]